MGIHRQSSIDAVSFSLMSIGARKNICFSVYPLPENNFADHSTRIKRNTFIFSLQLYFTNVSSTQSMLERKFNTLINQEASDMGKLRWFSRKNLIVMPYV